MVRMKLTARKHVRAPLRTNAVPTEAHSDGQNASYFLRTLWTALHRNPEAASWKLVPLACTCGDLREDCD
jgi:hypothetical protein